METSPFCKLAAPRKDLLQGGVTPLISVKTLVSKKKYVLGLKKPLENLFFNNLGTCFPVVILQACLNVMITIFNTRININTDINLEFHLMF